MRELYKIAQEIRKEWPNANYAAVPYLNAMCGLSSVNDSYAYGLDDGKTIVLYFLANAGTWRGEVARRIKAELRELVK